MDDKKLVYWHEAKEYMIRMIDDVTLCAIRAEANMETKSAMEIRLEGIFDVADLLKGRLVLAEDDE